MRHWSNAVGVSNRCRINGEYLTRKWRGVADDGCTRCRFGKICDSCCSGRDQKLWRSGEVEPGNFNTNHGADFGLCRGEACCCRPSDINPGDTIDRGLPLDCRVDDAVWIDDGRQIGGQNLTFDWRRIADCWRTRCGNRNHSVDSISDGATVAIGEAHLFHVDQSVCTVAIAICQHCIVGDGRRTVFVTDEAIVGDDIAIDRRILVTCLIAVEDFSNNRELPWVKRTIKHKLVERLAAE